MYFIPGNPPHKVHLRIIGAQASQYQQVTKSTHTEVMNEFYNYEIWRGHIGYAREALESNDPSLIKDALHGIVMAANNKQTPDEEDKDCYLSEEGVNFITDMHSTDLVAAYKAMRESSPFAQDLIRGWFDTSLRMMDKYLQEAKKTFDPGDDDSGSYKTKVSKVNKVSHLLKILHDRITAPVLDFDAVARAIDDIVVRTYRIANHKAVTEIRRVNEVPMSEVLANAEKDARL